MAVANILGPVKGQGIRYSYNAAAYSFNRALDPLVALQKDPTCNIIKSCGTKLLILLRSDSSKLKEKHCQGLSVWTYLAKIYKDKTRVMHSF